MGFPLEHGLHATLMAQKLAGLLNVDPETKLQTYYCCLLRVHRANARLRGSVLVAHDHVEAHRQLEVPVTILR
jgi:hypothetical protein